MTNPLLALTDVGQDRCNIIGPTVQNLTTSASTLVYSTRFRFFSSRNISILGVLMDVAAVESRLFVAFVRRSCSLVVRASGQHVYTYRLRVMSFCMVEREGLHCEGPIEGKSGKR